MIIGIISEHDCLSEKLLRRVVVRSVFADIGCTDQYMDERKEKGAFDLWTKATAPPQAVWCHAAEVVQNINIILDYLHMSS